MNRAHAIARLAVLVLLCALAAACGNKGELVKPEPPSAEAASTESN